MHPWCVGAPVSELLGTAILGAGAFGLTLAWWERGCGPPSDQVRLAPWVFLRLVAGMWILALFVAGPRASVLDWSLAPLAALAAFPWAVTALVIRSFGRVPRGMAALAAANFGGDPRRATRVATLMAADRRGDMAALTRDASQRGPDRVAALSRAALALHRGDARRARAELEACTDFETPFEAPLRQWHGQLCRRAEAASVAATIDARELLAPWIHGLDHPKAAHALRAWAKELEARALDAPALYGAWRRELAELGGLPTPPGANFGADLVALESRLEDPRTRASWEWDSWVELRTVLAKGTGSEAALRLALAEPALVALAVRAWAEPEGRAFAAAILSFLQDVALSVHDGARAERARANLFLAA